jgi:hypothetical protein
MNIQLACAVAMILLTNSACSVYKAVTQPGPADLSVLSIGTAREEVISRLGTPKLSETDPVGKQLDVFKFESGFHQGSKARIIPYLAADAFTFGLAEPILWAAELTVLERATCIAKVTYDESGKVDKWVLYEKAGLQIQGC